MKSVFISLFSIVFSFSALASDIKVSTTLLKLKNLTPYHLSELEISAYLTCQYPKHLGIPTYCGEKQNLSVTIEGDQLVFPEVIYPIIGAEYEKYIEHNICIQHPSRRQDCMTRLRLKSQKIEQIWLIQPALTKVNLIGANGRYKDVNVIAEPRLALMAGGNTTGGWVDTESILDGETIHIRNSSFSLVALQKGQTVQSYNYVIDFFTNVLAHSKKVVVPIQLETLDLRL